MVNQIRSRILHFLQLNHCTVCLDGKCVHTAAANLYFDEACLRIERPGKPIREMSYQKLNLDKLLMMVNPTAAVGSR
jgi:hypothetical protein